MGDQKSNQGAIKEVAINGAIKEVANGRFVTCEGSRMRRSSSVTRCEEVMCRETCWSTRKRGEEG